jgi:CheY-like chemotaxis protein
MSASVLYVEDEEYDALFMERAFRKSGTATALCVVTDGQQAIDYLAGCFAAAGPPLKNLPALVLLDLNLPGVSGFDVLRWIRSRQEMKNIPVVIFSSSGRPDERNRAQALGADDYLQKPGSALDFTAVVQTLQSRWLKAA